MQAPQYCPCCMAADRVFMNAFVEQISCSTGPVRRGWKGQRHRGKEMLAGKEQDRLLHVHVDTLPKNKHCEPIIDGQALELLNMLISTRQAISRTVVDFWHRQV